MLACENLWQAFEATVQARAQQPAIVLPGGEKVAYEALRGLALRAATLLDVQGAGTGDVVGLQLSKCVSTYALMLGCLASGAIYMPLDTKSPKVRLGRTLDRVRPRLLITEAGDENPHGATLRVAATGSSTDALLAMIEDMAPPNTLALPVNGAHPAYIMHTSGSTGEPKGAVIPHQGVLKLMRWGEGLITGPHPPTLTAINPLHFDNSVFDFYCGLLNGAPIAPIETGRLPNPKDWVDAVNASGATFFFAVPTLFLMLDDAGLLTPEALPLVRHFMFGGEGFPIARLRGFFARFEGRAHLTNVYGPTETSCICSSLHVGRAALDAAGSGLMSLGHMHEGFDYAVLDAELRAVPQGGLGELWIGGPCTGLGYYNNPDETGSRFRRDPRQAAYPSIMYRTGDLVTEDQSGALWFKGRADNQIKLGGHRIELEEIDRAAESFPGVRRALTGYMPSDRGPGLLATAYVAGWPLAPTGIRDHYRGTLPTSRGPSRVIEVPELPRNANGKVDRLNVQKLLAKAGHPAIAPTFPELPARGVLVEIWKRILGRRDVGLQDNFFDLGGTSLQLIRVQAEIRERLGVSLTVPQMFANPKVADLERFVQRQRGDNLLATARSRGERQRRILSGSVRTTHGSPADKEASKG